MGLVIFLGSCDEEEIPTPEVLNLPDTLFNYTAALPAHFVDRGTGGLFQLSPNDNDNTPIDNPTTNEGATLGRVLFYDKNLSANKTVSCASCHKQSLGFGDDRPLSLGFEGKETLRHSLSLANNRFYARKHYFSDERAATLEDLVLEPFLDPIEMGMTEDLLLQRIREQLFYEELFTDAFGDSEVTNERIVKAVAQFIRSIVSHNSKYDQGRAMVNSPFIDFPNFTAEENLGKTLFIFPQAINVDAVSCAGCHTSETFGPVAPINNGLDSTFTDLGAYNTFPYNHNYGSFKMPSLRNIAVSAPFMHDGRFETLEEVIEHYNSGIKFYFNLPSNLRVGDEPRRMNYTEEQKAALVAFLKTLTDDEFLTDEKFSNPFL